MPSNVQLPDGSVIKDVPDGTTRSQFIEKLRANGNANWRIMAEQADDYSPTSFLTHAISEPLMELFTGSVAAPVAGYLGLVTSAFEGADAGAKTVESVQNALTYRPKSEAGKSVEHALSYVPGKISEFADYLGQKTADVTGSPAAGAAVNTGVQAVPMIVGGWTGSMMRGGDAAAQAAANSAAAAARAAHYVQNTVGMPWADLSASAKAMMTSIATDAADLDKLDPVAVERKLRADGLKVPITRGQATRDPAQLKREEIVRGSDAGAPLRNIMADQDAALYRNLEEIRGSVAPNAKVGGQASMGSQVQNAPRRKLQVLSAKKRELYNKAEEAGETKMPVKLDPLMDWLKNPTNRRNAPYLVKAIKDYATKQDPAHSLIATPDEFGLFEETQKAVKDNVVSINDLEEIRKEAVANALGPPSPATHFAGEAISVIDSILDKSGSNVYQAARAANKAIKDEFERQGIVRKLSGSKPGTNDRSVALEDTFETTVVRGSAEDLTKVKRTLLQGGTQQTREAGARGWRDLQAAAVDYLKEAAGGKRHIKNERDQGQFNSAVLDKLNDLDNDGKLDILFGHAVADRMRNLAKTIHDVRTTPTLRNTGSDTVQKLMNLAEHASKLPIPIVSDIAAAAAKGAANVAKIGRDARAAAHAKGDPISDAAAAAARKRGVDVSGRLMGATVGGAVTAEAEQ